MSTVHVAGPGYGLRGDLSQALRDRRSAQGPRLFEPGGPAPEVNIPASKAAINVIAALHAQVTLQLLARPMDFAPGFTSLLFTLEQVPGIFAEAYRPFKFTIQQHRLFVLRQRPCCHARCRYRFR